MCEIQSVLCNYFDKECWPHNSILLVLLLESVNMYLFEVTKECWCLTTVDRMMMKVIGCEYCGNCAVEVN